MTTSIETPQQALELLEKAVEAKGEDYIYQPRYDHECRYVENGKPACIVGHALAFAGYPIQEISQLDYSSYVFGSSCIADDIPERIESVSNEAAYVFGAAQTTQDTGGTWAKALLSAKKAAEEIVRLGGL